MKKSLLIFICVITNTIYSYSQIFHELTKIELLKGKVKNIETFYSYPRKKHTTKIISEYDSLGKIVSEINYYIKENPQKEFFSYDSIGNLSLSIYQNNDRLQQYAYEYKYDTVGRIVKLFELKDGEFRLTHDKIIYNNDNLPVQYVLYHPYAVDNVSIQYSVGENGKKIIQTDVFRKHWIQENDTVVSTFITEEILLYNDKGFLIKEIRRKASSQLSRYKSNGLIDSGSIYNWEHFEEHDYVGYKYDKQGNWITQKCYLNWENRRRKLQVKIKRKIQYY